jgi:hypothetical protein
LSISTFLIDIVGDYSAVYLSTMVVAAR